MNTRYWLVACVTVLVAASVLAPAVPAQSTTDGQVLGRPDLSVTTSTPVLTPGGDQSLTLEILNDPDLRQTGPERYETRVTTARAVTLDIDDSGLPFDVRQPSVAVGEVPPGKTTVPPVTVTVPQSASPGTYEIPVDVTYSYTRLVSYDDQRVSYSEGRRTVDGEVTVRVDSRPRFEVRETRSTLQVGDTGTVAVTLANVGSETARDARVSLVSASTNARITGNVGGNISEATTVAEVSAAETAVYVGEWAPGEAHAATYTVAVDEDVDAESLAFRARVEYEDTDGVTRTSRPLSFGVRPTPEQSFALEDVRTDLRVGRTGTVSGTVVNTGETPVGNAVVVFSTDSPALVAQPRRVAVSGLDPGDTATFSFEVDVADDATATTHQADFSVEYRNQRGQRRVSDPLERTIEVAPERDRFEITPVNATFEIDSDNRFVVRITNRESVALRDVRARINATPPFTSESDTAYVDELAPGESALLAFEVTVSEDAVTTTTAVEVTVAAREPDGDRIRDGPYFVETRVTEPSGPGNTTLLGLGALAVVLVLGAGWWWLRR
ncbi:sialidase [Salinigranum rubrum]|uniref:Sialidase n=1 Tax=Salinigranum rubrum TaxID=755307 RepID=A0A2I8VNN2_9EURY|nr:NEW3 domain-containing protein [Salinigranum rubrum]AUV83528.1 sialidase [Salinigranum rubrum]